MLLGDTQSPSINNCPDDAFGIIPSGSTSVSVSWNAPTASDNSGIVTLTSNFNPGSQFDEGQTSVVYTAVDQNGLQTTCTFTVFVIATGEHILKPDFVCI